MNFLSFERKCWSTQSQLRYHYYQQSSANRFRISKELLELLTSVLWVSAGLQLETAFRENKNLGQFRRKKTQHQQNIKQNVTWLTSSFCLLLTKFEVPCKVYTSLLYAKFNYSKFFLHDDTNIINERNCPLEQEVCECQ